MAKTTFTPTDEQLLAVELAQDGGSLAIEALAGAGKTSTLRLVADALGTQGAYVAFNRKIVDDGKRSFPSNVACSTAHSLAMKAVGLRYRHRLDSNRMTNRDMARSLGLDVDTPSVFGDGDDTHELGATVMASLAHRTVEEYCRGADEKITAAHVPFQRGLDKPGGDYENNRALQSIVVPLAHKIWADVTRTEGQFRFSHNHYLKMWQLDSPHIAADFILFDECQDANPLMMDVVERQTHAQKIWVGDAQQMIYEWNGAVNAMERAEVANRCQLTESFRFGPEIAEVANVVLARLDGPEITGSGKPGRVEFIERPDAFLSRTNAEAVSRALYEMEQGRRVHLQGGTREIVSFAEAAIQLMAGRSTTHPELACFRSWAEVEAYAESEDGADLRLLVGLIANFGAAEIIAGLGGTVTERQADVTVSTGHKSKGAEWEKVTLLGDFPMGPNVAPADLRLMYVAATRAKLELDRTMVDLEGTEGQEDTIR